MFSGLIPVRDRLQNKKGSPHISGRAQLECERGTFICDYGYAGYSLQVKQQIGEMAINGSGIRDPARVLGISPTTVIENLKKKFQVASSE